MNKVRRFSFFKRGTKYRNIRVEKDGFRYASKLEAKVAQDLEFRRLGGELVAIRRQVRISLEAYGKHICDYIIDFVVEHPDGTKEYIEAKGYPTPEWFVKWKLFEAMMAENEPTAVLTIIGKGRP